MASFFKTWPATLLLLVLLLSADNIDGVNGAFAPPRRLLSKMKYSIGFGTRQLRRLPVLSPPKNLSSEKETSDNMEIDNGIDEKRVPAEASRFQSRHLLAGRLRGRPTPPGGIPLPPTPRVRPPSPPS